MAPQVVIRLTAQNDTIKPAMRIITLGVNHLDIKVGRASKSVSKGLFSGYSNAWFDSPVMSREHAKITMKPEDRVVCIQDVGSMHGTHLNGVELPQKVDTPLKNGDNLIFGAEVRRGPETFPACGFEVSYEWSEVMASNTFACPDSSDMEDAEGEEEDLSEDEQHRRQQQSSGDELSMSPSSQNNNICNAIDLTKEDSPEPLQSNRIDLTRDSPEKQAMDEQHVSSDNVEREADTSLDGPSNKSPMCFDSEDDSVAGFTPIHPLLDDNSSESGASEESNHSFSECDQELLNAVEGTDADSDELEIEDTYNTESGNDSSDAEMEDNCGSDNPFTYTSAPFDNSDIVLSDIRTRIQSPDSVADNDEQEDDDESEFGLTESEEAGLRALIEGNLLKGDADSSSEQEAISDSEEDSESEEEREPEVSMAKDVTLAAPAEIPGVLPSLQSVQQQAYLIRPQNMSGGKLGIPSSTIRQPSPSDAAMVKSAVPQQSNPSVGFCDIEFFGKPTTQLLGEKTGKNAFFEAREVNRAKFTKKPIPTSLHLATTTSKIANSSCPSFASVMTSDHPFSPDWADSTSPVVPSAMASKPTSPTYVQYHPGMPSVIANGQPSSICKPQIASSFVTISKLEPSLPRREHCSFLDKPDLKPVLTRETSPQFDMTSAHSYHVDKDLTAINAPVQASSRGIKINDIIDTSITVQRPQRMKRKAEEISEVTEDELTVWARSSSTLNMAKPPLQNMASQEAIVSQSLAQPRSSEPEARPTKRIKKLLENVGYAALGGVAVGAGLFTVLVATAPDFL